MLDSRWSSTKSQVLQKEREQNKQRKETISENLSEFKDKSFKLWESTEGPAQHDKVSGITEEKEKL